MQYRRMILQMLEHVIQRNGVKTPRNTFIEPARRPETLLGTCLNSAWTHVIPNRIPSLPHRNVQEGSTSASKVQQAFSARRCDGDDWRRRWRRSQSTHQRMSSARPLAAFGPCAESSLILERAGCLHGESVPGRVCRICTTRYSITNAKCFTSTTTTRCHEPPSDGEPGAEASTGEFVGRSSGSLRRSRMRFAETPPQKISIVI